ncbi:MAG: lipoyl(octanoyl) transferase LipB [bacterium]
MNDAAEAAVAAGGADIRARFLGRMPYGAAWDLQRTLWEERAEGRLAEDAFLFLEHEPVFTLGQGGEASNVLERRSPVDGREVPLVRANRGGEVTYHGPGQLMLYAVCDLRLSGRDVHAHCRRLEEVFLRHLAGLGIAAQRRAGTAGLWVGEEKILSLGVGARRWVTMHGVGFNVSTDLRFFEMIHACGEVGARATSLERLLGEAPPPGEVAEALLPLCAEVFGARVSTAPGPEGWLRPLAAAVEAGD